MTINRLKKKKRSSLRKKFVPAMLALALVFSAVMSMGFAKWQDQLTINATVNVGKRTAEIVSVAKHDEYTYADEEDVFYDCRYGEKEFNWLCYKNELFFLTRNVVAYKIPMNYSVDSSKKNATVTLYNYALVTSKFSNDGLYPAIHNSEYVYYYQSNSKTTFSSGDKALGPNNNLSSNLAGGDDGFHGAKGIPMIVTVRNPNTTSITLSGFTVSNSSFASVNVSSLSISANSTQTFIITPLRSSNQYYPFRISFSDDSGNSYYIDVNIDSNGTASLTGAKMANAPLQTFSMLNDLPSETTTEQTKETTTTTKDEATSTTTTTVTSTETESTTTSTTAAEAGTTTSAATAEETTTTLAPTTTTTPAPTTMTTTAATTATTTTQAPTTTEKPTTRTAAAEEGDENGEAE